MRLIKKTSQHRRDFTGILQCEHCDHRQELRQGYDDTYYHQNVIPRIPCGACGKDSPTDAPKTAPDVPAGVVL
jgi:primosomal protein N'